MTNTNLLQESILATSVAIAFGGSIQLIQLIPSNGLKILATSSLGGIGTIFVSRNKKSSLTLEEQIKQNTARQIQQLKTELLSQNQNFKNQFDNVNNKVAIIENSLSNLRQDEQDAVNQIDDVDNKLKTIENFLQTLEQDIISKIITEYASNLNNYSDVKQENFEQKLSEVDEKLNIFIEKHSRQNQSLQDKVRNIASQIRNLERPSSNTTTLEVLPSNAEETSYGDAVIKWLTDRNIVVEKYNSNKSSEYNLTLDKLAVYLGENYNSLAEIHRKLRGSITRGGGFQLALRDKTQNDIRINTQFGSMLKQAGFLSNYYYNRNNKVMHIGTHQNKDLEKYIYGDWFERFIYNKVVTLFKQHGLQSESLVNAETVFSNEDRYELDLLFLVKEHLFWIECKAGTQFDRDFPKYSDNHQQFLQLPKTQALVVCLSIDDATAANRTALWSNITVTNPESLLRSIRSVLNI